MMFKGWQLQITKPIQSPHPAPLMSTQPGRRFVVIVDTTIITTILIVILLLMIDIVIEVKF